jgi:hypothetical protein
MNVNSVIEKVDGFAYAFEVFILSYPSTINLLISKYYYSNKINPALLLIAITIEAH